MRVEGWKSKEVFQGFINQAEQNANVAMDEVVQASKNFLRSVTIKPPIVRQGGFSKATVAFYPKTGRNKGKFVLFNTDKRWTGRRTNDRDNLEKSIRRVNRPGSGNVRVYAGNALAYWARYIEKGYTDRKGVFHPGIHYLKAPFHAIKNTLVSKIAKG